MGLKIINELNTHDTDFAKHYTESTRSQNVVDVCAIRAVPTSQRNALAGLTP